MEESEKRRERLKAIRMEAAQVEGRNSNADTSPVPCLLSNPLLGTSTSLSGQDDPTGSCAAPRFDFYTDPVAAFSGSRRSKNAQDQFTPPRPRTLHFLRNHPPPQQFGPNFSPEQTMFAQSPHYTSGPQMNPQMTPPPPQQFRSNFSPEQASYAQGPHYGTVPQIKSVRMTSPFPMHQEMPPSWSGPPGTPNNCYSPDSSRSGNMFCPGLGRENRTGFSIPVQGWGLMGNSPGPGSGRGGSPNFNSGRGRGHWFANSSSLNSGRGGRGCRSHGNASALNRPELFYDKSMVDDPWRGLTPVIWNGNFLVKSSYTPGSSTSWLPQSVRTKKVRVLEPCSESESQQNLAEYLAASFNEAIDDPSNV